MDTCNPDHDKIGKLKQKVGVSDTVSYRENGEGDQDRSSDKGKKAVIRASVSNAMKKTVLRDSP